MSELVDLSKLDAPKVLEDLDFERLLADRKAAFIALYPPEQQAYWQKTLALESEPIVKLLQENCYLQLLERKRINEAAKATMLAYATGTDLDVIGANFNVKRLVVREANYNVVPPIAQELESDTDFRLRCQLAFESLSVAGPRSAYVFHALSAHGEIADVSVVSPQPAHVTVSVLSRTGKGEATEEILNAVRTKLNDDDIRPIADRVTVQSAVIFDYEINAKLHVYRGPEYEPIKNQAENRLSQYVKERRRLGRDITLSGIYAALHIEGVQRVEMLAPNKDIVLQPHQAGNCTKINISLVATDDY